MHAELTRVHPFRDGNGRLARLVADLTYVSAQARDDLKVYDWNVDRHQYIDALRTFDESRDVGALAEVVPDESLRGGKDTARRRDLGMG